MIGRLDGKVALITGGAGGIASACGRLFCTEGAGVALIDIDNDQVQQTALDIRKSVPDAKIIGIAADVSREEDAVRAVKTVISEFGSLDTLVNAAAVRAHFALADASLESWEQIIGINLMGTMNFCKAAIPELRKAERASIVNIATVFAEIGRAGMGQYDVSKAGIVSITRTLACEEIQHDIRVNAVSPGSTWTPFTSRRAKERGMTDDELRAEGMMAGGLMNRWADPIEIAYPILWLASDEASFITGAVLMADGGFSVR
jgi:meso-butanediol dehydrogenase/(S,S)-butanediol dehydrogenase/diacetyl reductase